MTALERLCKPYRATASTPVRDRSGRVTVEHVEGVTDPLLWQLRDATASSTGTAAAATATAGIPLNTAAVALLEDIASELSTFCQAAGITLGPAPLRIQVWRWGTHPDAIDVEGITRRWEKSIKFLLYPPRTTEIVGPCPECRKDKYRTIDSQTSALVAEGATVTCRCCEAEWTGLALFTLKERMEQIAVAD